MIDGERMGERSMYPVATNGVVLRVPENLADEARIILSQTWSATAAALDIDEDWPELEDEAAHHEPNFPQSATEVASPVTYLAVLALALTLLLAAVVFQGWFQSN